MVDKHIHFSYICIYKLYNYNKYTTDMLYNRLHKLHVENNTHTTHIIPMVAKGVISAL